MWLLPDGERVRLLFDGDPSAERVEALLVSLDVKSPVAIEVSAQVDGP